MAKKFISSTGGDGRHWCQSDVRHDPRLTRFGRRCGAARRAAAVANLYTETAAYLSPRKEIEIGRAKVLATFTELFDSVRQTNGRMEISFRIAQRQALGDEAPNPKTQIPGKPQSANVKGEK